MTPPRARHVSSPSASTLDKMMVEITEIGHASRQRERITAPILEELHSLRGLRVAVDDFGTGYLWLSLSHADARPPRSRSTAPSSPTCPRDGRMPRWLVSLDHPARPQPGTPAARRRHRDRRPGGPSSAGPRMQPRPGLPLQPGQCRQTSSRRCTTRSNAPLPDPGACAIVRYGGVLMRRRGT